MKFTALIHAMFFKLLNLMIYFEFINRYGRFFKFICFSMLRELLTLQLNKGNTLILLAREEGGLKNALSVNKFYSNILITAYKTQYEQLG